MLEAPDEDLVLEQTPEDRKRRRRAQPRMYLALNALHAALGRAALQSMRSGVFTCVVVSVPSAGWKPVIADCARLIGHWDMVLKPSPKRRGLAPDVNATEVAEQISTGTRMLIVSEDAVACVPTLVAAADLALTISQPSDEVVRRTIACVTRSRVPPVPAGIAQGLSYDELVAGIRSGTTPEQCVSRLLAARRVHLAVPGPEDAPDLDRLAGYGAALDWCRALVADIASWRAGAAAFPPGARAVFAGPPGTGKTTLVKAFAKAAQLPLVDASLGRAFATGEGHLGDVIRSVQIAFDAARAAAPCLLFIDELDSVPDRSRLTDRAREWWTPIVNHLLTLLDGASFDGSNLVVLGATNHPSALDSALLRPGRLDRVIEIPIPRTERDCEGILRHHLEGRLAGQDLAPLTPLLLGMSGAEIMALVREAKRRARSEARTITFDDLMSVAAPPERRPKGVLLRCSVHEAGHAVGALAVGHAVHSISILQKGDSAGRVSGSPDLSDLPTRSDLEDLVVIMLCGTAAEQVLLGSRSIGAGGTAGSDLAVATETIAAMRASYGLAGDLAFRSDHVRAPALVQSDPKFLEAVERDLSRLFDRACLIMRNGEDAVRRLSDALMVHRFLTGRQVEALLGVVPIPRHRESSSMVTVRHPDPQCEETSGVQRASTTVGHVSSG